MNKSPAVACCFVAVSPDPARDMLLHGFTPSLMGIQASAECAFDNTRRHWQAESADTSQPVMPGSVTRRGRQHRRVEAQGRRP